MKTMYWNPGRSLSNLVIVTLVALTGVVLVDYSSIDARGQEGVRVAAARRAAECHELLRRARLERGYPIDPEIDPARTGLLGAHLSPITSVSGHLASKQTTINPNFAAVLVRMLEDAGVQEGDCVAIGWTGSLPALNASLCGAIEEMGLYPVAIASASSSQYGANFPDLLWIDMERELFDAGLISFRSVAASRGGYGDRAAEGTAEGRALLEAAIERNGLPFIDCPTTAESLEQRMRLYERHAGGRPIRAYINVGGGTVSVGSSMGKELYQPGLNLTATPEALRIDSVMTRFAREGTPVIHLVEITALARAWGLPVAPRSTPAVGRGGLYDDTRKRWMAAGFLATIVVLLIYGRRAARAAREQASASERRIMKEGPPMEQRKAA